MGIRYGEKMKTYYAIVWVGGIYDEYSDLQEAFNALLDWRKKGYDDVMMEIIDSYTGTTIETIRIGTGYLVV
jgi:hypothetical protein